MMQLHPFLVHFPIAIWSVGSLMLLAALHPRMRSLELSAWLLLGFAGLMSIPAVLAGQADLENFATVQLPAMEQHRNLGNLIPWLMILVLVLKAHTTFSKKASQPPSWCWVLVAFFIAGLVLYVGWLGGSLVYEYRVVDELGQIKKK